MSVENHRHCQATVLGATGEPAQNGTTWTTISHLDLPNLPENWLNYFVNNINVTEDLADILRLINWLAGRIEPSKPLEGDIINISPSDGRTVNVNNQISDNYTGLVGITGSGTGRAGRKLIEYEARVENKDPDAPVIATLFLGDQELPIKAYSGSGTPNTPTQEERYVITEDRVWDIVLSGGENHGEPLDYNDDQETEQRYVVTENGHEYDIGVSGYGNSVLLNYKED